MKEKNKYKNYLTAYKFDNLYFLKKLILKTMLKCCIIDDRKVFN